MLPNNKIHVKLDKICFYPMVVPSDTSNENLSHKVLSPLKPNRTVVQGGPIQSPWSKRLQYCESIKTPTLCPFRGTENALSLSVTVGARQPHHKICSSYTLSKVIGYMVTEESKFWLGFWMIYELDQKVAL